MRVVITYLLFLFCISCLSLSAQTWSIKTSATPWAFMTPNVEVSAALSDKVTLNLPVLYNPWVIKQNTRLQQLTVMPGVRFWREEVYNRGFWGLNLVASKYHMGGLLDHAYRYNGKAFGLSGSYGYAWALGERWNIEFETGLGILYTDYAKYRWPKNSRKYGDFTKWLPMLTKLDISISYLF